jgi:hypothetical protein
MMFLTCLRKALDCKVSRDTFRGRSSAKEKKWCSLACLSLNDRDYIPSMMTLTQLAHLGRLYSPRSEVMKTCLTNSLTSLVDASSGLLKKSSELNGV